MAQHLFKICIYIFMLVLPCKQDEFINFFLGIGANILPLPLPELFLSAPEIIKFYGFKHEVHKIITEDEYFLEMHRILPERSYSPPYKKLPLLFLHGATASSATWILNTPSKSLGFLFANAGYDVWLANFRGTSYSGFHLTKSKMEKEFWDFSIDHYSIIDVPAMIDYILNKTKTEKLILIGHSTGSLSSILMLSNKTEYNKKVKAVACLSPIFTLEGMRNPLLLFASEYIDVWKMIAKNYQIYHLFPFPYSGFVICKYFPILCYFSYVILNAGVSSHTDVSRLHVFLTHNPDFMSVIIAEHLYQIYRSHQLRAFDYGNVKDNKRNYGTKQPPVYDVNKIQIPFGIFYGETDNLAGPLCAFNAMKMLPNVTAFHKLPYDHFDHFLAVNAHKLLFPKLKRFVDKSCE